MEKILYADHIRINDVISIYIPTVGEVCDAEDEYFAAVSMIVSTPYDMIVQLDDAGVDFSTIDTYELFCMMFSSLQKIDTRLIFGDLDLAKFELMMNEKTEELVFYDRTNGVVIDKAIHTQIRDELRRLLQLKKNEKKPGNEEGRKYMIKIARMQQRRQRREAKAKTTSQLEDIIISLVNTSEFKYDYQTIRDISIYQLYLSMNQIQHKIQFDNIMSGYYAGTIKHEDLRKEDKTWIRL